MNLRDDLAATIARAKAAGLTLHITVEDAERILRAYDEALALLRELNDALVIPSGIQQRVDAVLDRAEPPFEPPTCFSGTGVCLSPRACDYHGQCKFSPQK